MICLRVRHARPIGLKDRFDIAACDTDHSGTASSRAAPASAAEPLPGSVDRLSISQSARPRGCGIGKTGQRSQMIDRVAAQA
jgi:hypothetical protein